MDNNVIDEVICAVCAKIGTTRWTLKEAGMHKTLDLCLIHAEPLRLLLRLDAVHGPKRHELQDVQLKRHHVKPHAPVVPLDWYPKGA